MRGLVVLGIVIGGAVAAFAVYTLRWHDESGGARRAGNDRTRHVYTLKQGDVVHVPGAAVRCEVSHEAGIPNLFCVHTGRTRYQSVLWKDRADLYDLARHGEPMVPTYSVPSLRGPLSAFSGVRQGHGRTLSITDAGYAREQINSGCCKVALRLEFRLSRPGGGVDAATAVATVTRVRVGDRQWFGKGTPPPRVGETGTIRLRDRNVYEGLTHVYYCRPATWRYKLCGA